MTDIPELVSAWCSVGEAIKPGIFKGTDTTTHDPVVIKWQSTQNVTGCRMLEHNARITKLLTRGKEYFDGFENIKHIHNVQIIHTVFGYLRQCSTAHIPTEISFICLHYFYRPRKVCPMIHRLRWNKRDANHVVLVTDALGTDLETLHTRCGRTFSLKTVLMLADQMLSIMESVHDLNIIHRGLSPQHFVMGHSNDADRRDKVHLIDFSLSKKYVNPKTNKHIEYVEGKKLTGVPRYVSINAHLGIEPSRRDDLETLGYIWIYFHNGSLPWIGIRARTRADKYWRIAQSKMNVPVETLCHNMPYEFVRYLAYCRSLRFEQKPDYVYLRRLFKDLFFRKGFVVDYRYDWTLLNPIVIDEEDDDDGNELPALPTDQVDAKKQGVCVL